MAIKKLFLSKMYETGTTWGWSLYDVAILQASFCNRNLFSLLENLAGNLLPLNPLRQSFCDTRDNTAVVIISYRQSSSISHIAIL
jgi:hypothetical protein